MTASADVPYPQALEVRRRILAALDARPGHQCLDIGPGSSALPARLAALGADVTCVDPLPVIADENVKVIRAPFLEADLVGGFDRVIMSLSSMFMGPADLRMTWFRISELLAVGGLVVAVDLHPVGRVSAVPWRRRSENGRYWGDVLEVGAVVVEGGESRISYRFYRLRELLEPAIAAGLRLVGVEEFPTHDGGVAIPAPGYLLTVWSPS